MHRLIATARPYAWGSTTHIQDLLKLPHDGRPLAELWFGAHPTGPSRVEPAEDHHTLDRLISSNPKRHLGEDLAREFGELPFLMKLLAPGQPVSLQVHPTPDNARAGFAYEKSQGIPLEAPQRSFKDANHKPEMIFALTKFEGLVGFRDVAEIIELLGAYELPLMREIHAKLRTNPRPSGMRACLEALVQIEAANVDLLAAEADLLSGNLPPDKGAPHRTVVELTSFYPGDAGAIASLMLNRIAFEPGECVFVSSGTPHAYLSGLAVEIMANSDNVFRAGLTTKYVDVEGLLNNIDIASGPVALLPGEETSPGVRVLRPNAREFQLTSITLNGTTADLAASGPRIGVCVSGYVQVLARGTGQQYDLSVGQAVFADDAQGSLNVSGTGHVVFGSVPLSQTN